MNCHFLTNRKKCWSRGACAVVRSPTEELLKVTWGCGREREQGRQLAAETQQTRGTSRQTPARLWFLLTHFRAVSAKRRDGYSESTRADLNRDIYSRIWLDKPLKIKGWWFLCEGLTNRCSRDLVKSHDWNCNYAQVILIQEENDFREYLNDHNTKSLKLPINVGSKSSSRIKQLKLCQASFGMSRQIALTGRRLQSLSAGVGSIPLNKMKLTTCQFNNPAGSEGSTLIDPG